MQRDRANHVFSGGHISKNIHGLDRHIPEDVRRQIRQECGFGCVICGMAIVQYEHIDPPFAEANTHDPQKIALLCGSCHDRVTRGIWSKARVLEARRAPRTFKQGFAKDAFDINTPFEAFVGNNCFKDISCIVRKGRDQWFSIEPPETPEGPPRLSAKFFTPNGEPTLEIDRNEWRCLIGVWDLKVSGYTIEVWTEPSNLMLQLKARPPHGLEIVYLDMSLEDTRILVETDGTVHLTVNGIEIDMKNSRVSTADAIFVLP
jgi:hypothetical protein